MNLFADTLYNFENEMDEARFNNLIKDIRCPKCISGSLSSSNAPISEDLKLKILIELSLLDLHLNYKLRFFS